MAAKIHRLGHKGEGVDTARARRYVARAAKRGAKEGRAAIARATAAHASAPELVTQSGRQARPRAPESMGTSAPSQGDVNKAQGWFQSARKPY